MPAPFHIRASALVPSQMLADCAVNPVTGNPDFVTMSIAQEINAFALPGGSVYITRGILGNPDSEAGLAAVLGHEIGHVTARPSVQQLSAATAADIGATALQRRRSVSTRRPRKPR